MHSRLFVLLFFLFGSAGVASAQIYWNPNATVPITGGTGTWDSNTTAAWNNSASGSATLVKWSTDSLIASFRGNGGTITVGAGGVTASAIRFDATGYTLVGSVASTSSSYIGFTSGLAGGVTFTGASSVWSNTGNLYVGSAATGALTVSGGAHVAATKSYLGNTAGIQGTATVTGTGSQWNTSGMFYVGNTGTGSLTVQNGGAVTNANVDVGSGAGSSGTVAVTGAGSTWSSAGQLNLGHFGTGSLTVSAGGTVTNTGSGYLGGYSGGSAGTGTATVTGTGSSWTSTGNLFIGYLGTGTLTLADHGNVKVGSTGTGTLRLADQSGSAGTLNIGNAAAAGTLQSASVLGGSGTAIVNFNHTDSAYTFAPNLQGTLAVNFLGSGTTILTGTSNTYSGATSVSAGTLLVNGSGWVANSLITVASGATLGGTGLIGSPTTTIQSGGHLAPGGAGAPGTLSFTNDLTLNGGAILDFQLGTTSDRIVLGGGAGTILTGPASGRVMLNLSDAGGFATGIAYTLIDFTAAGVPNFATTDFTFGGPLTGYTYNLAIINSTLQLTASASAIPEPSTYAIIFGACALGLAAWRRRRPV